MSTMPEIAPVWAKRSFWRFWYPIVVPVLALVAVAGFWGIPSQDWERVNRVAGTYLVIELTMLLYVIWLLFLSGLRWWLRLMILVSVIGTLLALGQTTVRNVHFSGDMVPTFEFRWEPTQDEILEASRGQPSNRDAAAIALAENESGNYPEYRNRRRDGVVVGPALSDHWEILQPRWRKPVGGGYSGFAIAGNLAVTMEQRREEEAVVAYDTATGAERWIFSYPARFSETLGGDGPRSTPTVKEGDVYALGATGMLHCLEAKTGKLKWSVDILNDNDNLRWAMSGSPLVYDKVVVVNPGSQREEAKGRALVAYDRVSGEVVWQAGETQAGYSSPMLANLAGRRQIVLFDGAGVAGYDAGTGRELWRYPGDQYAKWDTQYGINVAQPIVLEGDRVFISSGYGVGCAMLKITREGDNWSVEERWRNKNLRCRFTSPVAYQGYIYGLDEGILVCLDQESGERKWKEGRYGHGQLLLTGGRLVILSETGALALVEASPQRYHPLTSLQALSGKTWNYLSLAGGKAYVRNHKEMACYDLAERGTDK
jgi:outer membrane protein assembly factor BamB